MLAVVDELGPVVEMRRSHCFEMRQTAARPLKARVLRAPALRRYLSGIGRSIVPGGCVAVPAVQETLSSTFVSWRSERPRAVPGGGTAALLRAQSMPFLALSVSNLHSARRLCNKHPVHRLQPKWPARISSGSFPPGRRNTTISGAASCVRPAPSRAGYDEQMK